MFGRPFFGGRRFFGGGRFLFPFLLGLAFPRPFYPPYPYYPYYF
ncbi:MAG: hypothetical protein ACOXZS_01350 [Bacilli bacterium]